MVSKCGFRADTINGFMCDFEVYAGKDVSPEQHLGSKVVKKLWRLLVGGDITST